MVSVTDLATLTGYKLGFLGFPPVDLSSSIRLDFFTLSWFQDSNTERAQVMHSVKTWASEFTQLNFSHVVTGKTTHKANKGVGEINSTS